MDPYNFCFGDDKCPVCESPYVVPTRLLKSYDKTSFYILKYCMKCSSFSNLPPEVSMTDLKEKNENIYLDWHLEVMERNKSYSRELLKSLRAEIDFNSILEIGCGIGTFLNEAKEQGYGVLGFDLDKKSIDYGKKKYDIPIYARNFSADSVKEKYQLVVCISTLEHLRSPRSLIKGIANYCKKHGSSAFVFVPFFTDKKWTYLINPDSEEKGNPFTNNDEHIIHFSKSGFLKAFSDFGLRRYTELIPEKGWRGMLFSDYTL